MALASFLSSFTPAFDCLGNQVLHWATSVQPASDERHRPGVAGSIVRRIAFEVISGSRDAIPARRGFADSKTHRVHVVGQGHAVCPAYEAIDVLANLRV